MKSPNIIHTDFLENLVEDLNRTSYHLDIDHHFSAKQLLLEDNIDEAIEMCSQDLHEQIKLLNNLWKTEDYDLDDETDIKQSIKSTNNTITNLNLLQTLGGADYATPTKIRGSIKTLSRLQLKAKLPMYTDSDYYSTITEVLDELVELLKEV